MVNEMIWLFNISSTKNSSPSGGNTYLYKGIHDLYVRSVNCVNKRFLTGWGIGKYLH